MSVRAYITRETSIWVDEVNKTYYNNNDGEGLIKYTHTDHEYVINIWHQDRLIQEMLNYGAEDYTNQDFVGDIEMGKEDWDTMLEHCKKIWSPEDWDSINTIDKYFREESDWLILTCY